MKNIAIIVHALTGGGAERIAGLLSVCLAKKYNVYLFLLNQNSIIYEYAGKIVNVGECKWYEIEENIRRYKVKYKIDCAISFLMEMNLCNLRTKSSEKVIISHRCSIGESELQFFEREKQIIRDYYSKADSIVACSYGNKYDLTHNYGIDGEIITTIYNFVDKQEVLSKAKAGLNIDVINFIGSSKLILNVGRLEPQKNQVMLLRQFYKLVKENYDVKLIILGKGTLENDLKEFASSLGIADRVRFETYCENPFPYYNIATLLACSTDFEGLPNVIIEAMTIGLPVVSVDCLSGPRELIKINRDYSLRTHKVELCTNGVLVEKAYTDKTGKTNYFAQGMKLLLDDPALCDKITKNEQKYMKVYDNDMLAEKWMNLIEEENARKSKAMVLPLQFLKDMDHLIIYGAGEVGRRILHYICDRNITFEFLAFAVTKKAGCAEEVDNVPVYQIDELNYLKEKATVIVGVSRKFEEDVVKTLRKKGFKYVYSDLDAW